MVEQDLTQLIIDVLVAIVAYLRLFGGVLW